MKIKSQPVQAEIRPEHSQFSNATPTQPSAPPSTSRGAAGLAPTLDEIKAAAEALWRKKGCPRGDDEAIWLEAEAGLRDSAWQRDERDRVALADPGFSFNHKGGDLMNEVDSLFPGPTGKETTSL